MLSLTRQCKDGRECIAAPACGFYMELAGLYAQRGVDGLPMSHPGCHALHAPAGLCDARHRSLCWRPPAGTAMPCITGSTMACNAWQPGCDGEAGRGAAPYSAAVPRPCSSCCTVCAMNVCVGRCVVHLSRLMMRRCCRWESPQMGGWGAPCQSLQTSTCRQALWRTCSTTPPLASLQVRTATVLWPSHITPCWRTASTLGCSLIFFLVHLQHKGPGIWTMHHVAAGN